MKYFISFVEEFWNGQLEGTTLGRIEVYGNKNPYGFADEEIRWGTRKVDEFYTFRDKWDWKNLTKKQLNWFKTYVKENYDEG